MAIAERAVRRTLFAALAGLALASPVTAQDVASDYTTAYMRSFGNVARDDQLSIALSGLRLLDGIEGIWLSADRAMNGPEFLPQMTERFCAANGLRIAREGDFGFTTETIRNGVAQGDHRTYVLAHGNFFSFITDLDGQLNRVLGSRDRDTVPPQTLFGMLSPGTQSGIARIEAVGPNVLMIDSPTAGPSVLVRCPG